MAVAYGTGRASHARQVKGVDPDTKGYPGPQGWGFGVGLRTPPSKKNLLLRNSSKRKSWIGEMMTDGRRVDIQKYMESTNHAKTWKKLEGTRRKGRPRKRWKEEVERDLQVLGVRRWRELVADRKKRKDIV